jgi:lipid II:glycine glycyltransferase (peptidoglycan interpeptide bridge formation enzyme)
MHVQVSDRAQWNDTLTRLPNAHVLQSWEWGEFKSRWGWTVDRLLWRRQNSVVGAAQVLIRPVPHTPWQFMYLSKGPAFDYTDISLTEMILADLEQLGQQSHSLFIKIDPDVVRQFGEPGEAAPDPAGSAFLTLLERRGWQYSPEQIQFKNTVLIDLSGNPDDWLNRMKSKWRYNIRYAMRKGVKIRRGTDTDIPGFYNMYVETATRDGFLIRPEAYYHDVWRRFMTADLAEMLLAEVDGQVVAGLLLFLFGERAWYLYGASTGQHRQLMPNHLLQWEAMLRAKARGCTHYDLWGAPDEFEEHDRMWGVYRFKQGFGGQPVQGMGAFDYPVRPVLYRLFVKALPLVRSLLGQLSG